MVSRYLKLGHTNAQESNWEELCQSGPSNDLPVTHTFTGHSPYSFQDGFPPMGSISNAIGDLQPLPSKAGRCIPRGLTRQQLTLTVQPVGIQCHLLNSEQMWRFSFPLLTRNSPCISNRHFSYCLPKVGDEDLWEHFFFFFGSIYTCLK